jgi:exopolysaccharide biosynthesis polyprenyl glycosylphosphotransferase
MNKKQRQFIRTFLILSDILTSILSFYAAYAIRNYFFGDDLGSLQGINVYSWILAIIIPLWPVLLALFNVYSKTIHQGFKKAPHIILSLFPPVIIGSLLITSFLYFIGRQEISRLFLMTFAIVNLVMLSLEKIAIQYLWNKRAKDTSNCRKVIVVTCANRNYFTEYANKNPHFLIDIVGYVQAGNEPLNIGRKLLGPINNLIDILKNNTVDEVVFDLPGQQLDNFEDLIYECEKMGISIHVVLYTFDLQIAKPDISMLGNIPILTFKTIDFNPWQMLIKRFIDITAGLFGILCTAITFIFIAPAIKLESEGPVFFSQNRMGRNGRVFKVYKYRSMYKDAEERKKLLMKQNEINSGHMFKITNDPRITKVGRFIRKTSIDEFPQFWNIFKGDMSLVGTRPPTLDEVNKYETHHWRRLSIKPGLTGMWQVSGRSDVLDFDDVVKMDLEYIDRWSLWLDFKIMLKTFPAVFKMDGSK